MFVGGVLDGRRIPKGGVGQWPSYRDLNGHSVWAEHGDARLRRGEPLYVLRPRDHQDHTSRIKDGCLDRVYVLSGTAPIEPSRPTRSRKGKS